MNKAERINDMLLYLNDKKYFNLKDIMERYTISKSTALRDIQSLETIGMPIYSEMGWYGRYGILKNRLLSPIIFTIDEMYALYFSMLTLKSYSTTPFHLDILKLEKKFQSCLSKEHILKLEKMKEVLSFQSIKHPNSSPLLKDILELLLEEKSCSITYQKDEIEKNYVVQFITISTVNGQWYVTTYNHETKNIQIFRCDKIKSIKENEWFISKSLTQLKANVMELYKKKSAIEFEIEIKEKGVDIFHKEHYPSMNLYFENNSYYIRGYYNKGEEKFITNYLINYGNVIKKIEPINLKEMMLKRVSDLQKHFQSL
ncbi:MAG: helix-turn-helix transcriptional regulator [Coprobacillaceae bacterium]